MKIRITKEHIKNGIPNDTYSCPIALACKKRVKDFSCVDIDGIMRLENDYIPFPKYAQKFIKDFDEGKQVKPFTLNIKYENKQ